MLKTGWGGICVSVHIRKTCGEEETDLEKFIFVFLLWGGSWWWWFFFFSPMITVPNSLHQYPTT